MTPLFAGVTRMKYYRFLPYNLAAAVVWAVAYSLVGYAFGQYWDELLAVARSVGYGVVGLVVLVLARLPPQTTLRTPRRRGQSRPHATRRSGRSIVPRSLSNLRLALVHAGPRRESRRSSGRAGPARPSRRTPGATEESRARRGRRGAPQSRAVRAARGRWWCPRSPGRRRRCRPGRGRRHRRAPSWPRGRSLRRSRSCGQRECTSGVAAASMASWMPTPKAAIPA